MLDDLRTQATFNKMGWSSEVPNEYSEAFVAYASDCTSPMLDIGAAFGTASIAALEAGATVDANDVEPRHLEVLQSRVRPQDLQRLKTIAGGFLVNCRFPMIISEPSMRRWCCISSPERSWLMVPN